VIDADLDARRARGAAVYARTLGVPATESAAALATGVAGRRHTDS